MHDSNVDITFARREQKVVTTSYSQASPNQVSGTTDAFEARHNLLRVVCMLDALKVHVRETRRDMIRIRQYGSHNNPIILTAFNAIIPCRLHFFSQSSGNFKGSFEMLCVRSLLVFPLKGLRPNISSYAQTPSDHQSMV